MKTVCRVLGVARSHVYELHDRSEDWRDGRKGRTPAGDAQLLAEIRQQISDLPSYGYRRACALVNRQRSTQGSTRVNPKRAYRVMAQAGLLLPKASTAPVQQNARGQGSGWTQRSALVFRWAGDQVRLGADGDDHVRQGLL